jgi:hypothetical protein
MIITKSPIVKYPSMLVSFFRGAAGAARSSKLSSIARRAALRLRA